MIELTENQIEMVNGAAAWTAPIGNLFLGCVDMVNGVANYIAPAVNFFSFIPLFDQAHKFVDQLINSALTACTNIGNSLGGTYQMKNPNHFQSEWAVA